MERKNIILKIIVLILFILTLVFVSINKTKKQSLNDALKFKEEYESLNDKLNSDGNSYNNVEIPENNPIKYITVKEAINIIKNGEGVIYFGANWCPWCRNAVGVLLDAASNKMLDTIYYLDMDKVRNKFSVVDGKITKIQVEQDGYYELLDLLDEVLSKDTYKITDSDGNVYDTNEKRIYIPFVIAVKNGKILNNHISTVELNDNQNEYSYLTDEQKNELFKIYIKIIESIELEDSCGIDTNCD
mgnify:CR=1 FL=1